MFLFFLFFFFSWFFLYHTLIPLPSLSTLLFLFLVHSESLFHFLQLSHSFSSSRYTLYSDKKQRFFSEKIKNSSVVTVVIIEWKLNILIDCDYWDWGCVCFGSKFSENILHHWACLGCPGKFSQMENDFRWL